MILFPMVCQAPGHNAVYFKFLIDFIAELSIKLNTFASAFHNKMCLNCMNFISSLS